MKRRISAFFPAYNDEATIGGLVERVEATLRQVASEYEIIVIDDGSRDNTGALLDAMVRANPHLRVIHHGQNRGYGGALRSGFAAARLDWVFYTDGDGQYDPAELATLVARLRDGVDVVQGYKIRRQDPVHRIVIGWSYGQFVRLVFGLKIRDVDCDFRLIRRDVFDLVQLESNGGSICVEMVRKIQDAGRTFVEAPVHHYPRMHGRSQFLRPRRVFETFVGLGRLWWQLSRGLQVVPRPAAADQR
ncbi:MAG: glycosyltransferase family 2 protein [Chloroflexi bacterium]|nr:glycosyltransferase family 2 protein [Chloroflexota bacterium]